VYVEDASRSRDDLDNVDCLLPLLENARNQTGRVGQRASGNAVLDPDTMLGGHQSIVVSVGLLSAEVVPSGRGPTGTPAGERLIARGGGVWPGSRASARSPQTHHIVEMALESTD
jgi:hypothetical protein